ncbi:MAG: hypothetical protein U1E35_07010 [Rhodospirillales bacterium]
MTITIPISSESSEGADEPQQHLAADPLALPRRAHLGDAGDESAEHQRADDRLIRRRKMSDSSDM